MKLFIGFIGRTQDGQRIKIVDSCSLMADFIGEIGLNKVGYWSNGKIATQFQSSMDIVEELPSRMVYHMSETLPEPDRTQKVDVLLAALEFYARYDITKTNKYSGDDYGNPIRYLTEYEADMGEIARQALQSYKGNDND